ncbi:type VII secretion protein EccE [Mycobacteroides abscessus subsp. abscessus]|uniref:type VII secretion protein EccE n=3 Tax=Mycobacteroides abscessus TaxID=36809 RepID=UPI000929C878|nr:type VII secretion protein EccE [Mycobacteroides abscessus]SHS18061.1 type VII secretion protein EccE [Mycobacteroides abscessus subsp. abscessus]
MTETVQDLPKATAATDASAALATGKPGAWRRWGITGRALPLVVAEVIVSLIAVAFTWPSWWLLAALAVLVGLLAVVTFDGVTVTGWARRAARFLWWRRRKGTRVVLPEPFDETFSGIGTVGMQWDGQYLVTMLALSGRAHAPTVLAGSSAKTRDTVPIDEIVGLMRQFGGIELASADVITVGRRAGDSDYAGEYDAMIGNRPAVGLRRTWLVLRLAPQGCLVALAYRKSVEGAVAAATERIRQAIVRAGCRAAICNAAQVRTALATIASSEEPGEIKESWSGITGQKSGYIGVYRVPAVALGTALIDQVWSVPTQRTVVATRFTREASGVIRVGTLVRMHTQTEMLAPPLVTLETLPGQAFDAWMATLPTGERSMRVSAPTRAWTDSDTLDLPVGPTGPMLGASERSHYPMLCPLIDPVQPTLISVKDDPVVLVQLVLRAAASGLRVTVVTDRPQLWAPLHPMEIEIADQGAETTGQFIVWDQLSVEDADSVRPAVGRGQSLLAVGHFVDTSADIGILTDGKRMEVTAGKAADRGKVRAVLQVYRTRTEARFLDHAEAYRDSIAAAAR